MRRKLLSDGCGFGFARNEQSKGVTFKGCHGGHDLSMYPLLILCCRLGASQAIIHLGDAYFLKCTLLRATGSHLRWHQPVKVCCSSSLLGPSTMVLPVWVIMFGYMSRAYNLFHFEYVEQEIKASSRNKNVGPQSYWRRHTQEGQNGITCFSGFRQRGVLECIQERQPEQAALKATSHAPQPVATVTSPIPSPGASSGQASPRHQYCQFLYFRCIRACSPGTIMNQPAHFGQYVQYKCRSEQEMRRMRQKLLQVERAPTEQATAGLGSMIERATAKNWVSQSRWTDLCTTAPCPSGCSRSCNRLSEDIDLRHGSPWFICLSAKAVSGNMPAC